MDRTTKPNPANRINALRHLGLRHALAIEVHFADAFDARENVINRLAANAHKLGADDARYEIARKIENFLRRAAFEALAKNRGHCASERLHFGAKRHADVRLAIFIDMQIDADRIHAFLILAYVFEVEFFAWTRLLFLRVLRVRDKRLAPLIFRERFEEIDDLVQLLRVHRRTEIFHRFRGFTQIGDPEMRKQNSCGIECNSANPAKLRALFDWRADFVAPFRP